MTAAGQDGERLVTDEMVERATSVMIRENWPGNTMYAAIRAALAAVAADLDRAGYDRRGRECAEELRTEVRRLQPTYALATRRLGALADRWSPSDRAPAGEEQQR